MTDLVLYRGQKTWLPSMVITAPSLRRANGVADPDSWTDGLLAIMGQLLAQAASGDAGVRKQLEHQMLTSQQVAPFNPYVSCTFSKSVAASFALAGDTPGYLLEIRGDRHHGLDYEATRRRYGLYGDAMDYLREFGVPKLLEHPFFVARVELVSDLLTREVYP